MAVVNLKIDAAIARVTLNRPDALNAVNPALACELEQCLQDIATREDIRCVVLDGVGRHFTAGGDVAYFNHLLERGGDIAAQVKQLLDNIHGVINTLRSMPQPVVAAVQGACAGFGVSLMCACDLAVVVEGSVFTLAYCHLGVNPDGGSTWLLPRTIGMKRASELLLLGDRFDAVAARQMGLVNRVVPAAAFAAEIDKLSARLAAGPAKANARGKRLLQQSLQTPLHEQLDAERESFLRCTTEPDFVEGVRAFMEKRKPDFRSE